MGPKAKEALPLLEKTFADAGEDLDVRVGAARAIARIKGTDVFDLYKQIPNLEEDLIALTKEKVKAQRMAYAKLKAAEDDPGGWGGCGWWLYCLHSGDNLDQMNEKLLKVAHGNGIGAFMDVNSTRVFVRYNSKSEFCPNGRLYPETEEALKGYFFRFSDKGVSKLYNANIPMNKCSREYLALGVLKDDPAYKNRKLQNGDTVTERYEYWNKAFKQHLETWVRYGLWDELGSSNYEYHTFPSYLNLAEMSPDPEVRKLAKMFMDMALVEAAQLEIVQIRGGVKARAKRGGLGSSWNPYKAMLYGRRGATLYHSSTCASDYFPPDAAILLTKLGPSQDTYEVANVYGGAHKRPINYAYRTPEYISGCVMADPNKEIGANNEGRWTGVIFRDFAYIGFPAYGSEKWNVQSKDVRILQARKGAYYGGWPRVAFSAGLDMLEKDGWIFVDNGEAYGAVKILGGGYFWADPVRSLLYQTERFSPIVLQTGMKKDYNSFKAFQKAILDAPLEYKDDKVTYQGPNADKLEFFSMTPGHYQNLQDVYTSALEDEQQKIEDRMKAEVQKKAAAEAEAAGKTGRDAERFVEDAVSKAERENANLAKEEAKEAVAKRGIKENGFTLPKINGKTMVVDPEYAYRSPYLESKFGSDVVTIRYGKHEWRYDLAKGRTEQVK
jgi:hypothetical protein